MHDTGDHQSSRLQVPGHVLHRLVHLVRVPEYEPRGQDVLQGVAAQGLVHLAVLREVLKYVQSQRDSDVGCISHQDLVSGSGPAEDDDQRSLRAFSSSNSGAQLVVSVLVCDGG